METLKYRANADSEWKEIIAIKGNKGDTGEQGPQGEPGIDGYTPIKGTDYFTQEEIDALTDGLATKEYVDNAISALVNGDEVSY